MQSGLKKKRKVQSEIWQYPQPLTYEIIKPKSRVTPLWLQEWERWKREFPDNLILTREIIEKAVKLKFDIESWFSRLLAKKDLVSFYGYYSDAADEAWNNIKNGINHDVMFNQYQQNEIDAFWLTINKKYWIDPNQNLRGRKRHNNQETLSSQKDDRLFN